MNNDNRLEAGLKILGVYFIVQGLYGLVSAMAVGINGGLETVHTIFFAFIHPFVFFASAFCVIKKSKALIRILNKDSQPKSSDPA